MLRRGSAENTQDNGDEHENQKLTWHKSGEPVVDRSATRRISSNRCELTGRQGCQSSQNRRPLLRAVRRHCKKIRKRQKSGGIQVECMPCLRLKPQRGASLVPFMNNLRTLFEHAVHGALLRCTVSYMMRCDVVSARNSSFRCSVKGSSETGFGVAAAGATTTAAGGGATAWSGKGPSLY